MKRIMTMLLVCLTLFEIIILLNSNKELKLLNIRYNNDLEEINASVDNKKLLEDINKQKSAKKKEVEELFSEEVFNEDNIDSILLSEEKISNDLKKEITVLEEKIIGLETDITSLEAEYQKLSRDYEAKNTIYIVNVPTINQYPNYPTGCESVALTILLKYYGVNVSPDEIVEKLDKESRPYKKDNVLYGGNPEVGFIGDPKTNNSYGVFEKPIAKLANMYKSGINVATGTSFEEILSIVKKGTPVMVWTSMNLSMPYISTSWIYEPTGETIYWKSGEHAVILIGYTPDKVIISDPIGGKIKYQPLSTFKERYNYFGKRALYY